METQELQQVISKKKDQFKKSESKLFLHERIVEGLKFGKWTTQKEKIKRGSSWYVNCLCDCGLNHNVLIYDLVRKTSTQCRSCNAANRNLKHGQNCHDKITYEYHLWINLKNLKLLTAVWRDNFELFFKDVGVRPDKKFMLLRKNSAFLHSVSNSYWGHHKLRLFRNLEGQTFGKWTVIEKDLHGKGIRWLCECECGKKDYILQSILVRNLSERCKSCSMKGKNTKHGHSLTSVYRIFYGMKDRCYKKTHKNFPHYGGRGIKICDRWLNSIENFINDIGERPSLQHSIDRIDVNGPYSPENCKWSLQKEQTQNRRKMVDVQNEVLHLRKELEKYKARFGEL